MLIGQPVDLSNPTIHAAVIGTGAVSGDTPPSVWYPLTLSGCVFAPQDGVSWFQDAAGVVPAASVGDPVGNWHDPSVSAAHLTQNTTGNKPLLAAGGRNGQLCLSFNGSSSILSTATCPDLSTGQAYSFGLWLNSSETRNTTIMGMSQANASNVFALWEPNRPSNPFVDWLLSGGVFLAESSVNPLDGAWHHLVVTASGTTWTVYVDGTSVATGTKALLPSGLSTISLGGRIASGAGVEFTAMKGSNPLIYNRALSASEVLGLKNNT